MARGLAALAFSAWVVPALAQPAPPSAPPQGPAAPGPGFGPMGGQMGGPMGGPGFGPRGMPMGPPGAPPWMMGVGRGPFGGLVFRREDRQLTAAEVQRIAEAFLLWQGERSWKIAEVHEAPDNAVAFTLTTAEGSVIARFTMDRRSGRVHRTG
jgi:hypothetical protein